MEKQTAIEQIKKACNGIALELMKIHPAVRDLGDKAVQDELYPVLYELTKQVEIVKKKVMRLGIRDDQKDL